MVLFLVQVLGGGETELQSLRNPHQMVRPDIHVDPCQTCPVVVSSVLLPTGPPGLSPPVSPLRKPRSAPSSPLKPPESSPLKPPGFSPLKGKASKEGSSATSTRRVRSESWDKPGLKLHRSASSEQEEPEEVPVAAVRRSLC